MLLIVRPLIFVFTLLFLAFFPVAMGITFGTFWGYFSCLAAYGILPLSDYLLKIGGELTP